MSPKQIDSTTFSKLEQLPDTTVTNQKQRPNVLLVLMDDVGVDYLQQYNSFQVSHLGYATGAGSWGPVTTGFATVKSEGVIFNSAFAAPVCSPTRAMLLTGRYPSRTGIGTVVRQDMVSVDDKCREFADASFSAEPCMPEFVKPKGYRTMLCGKWHLNLATEAMDPDEILTEHGTIGWDGPLLVGGFDVYEGLFRNPNKLPYPTTGTYDYGYYNYYWYDSATGEQEQIDSAVLPITRKQRQRVQNFINNGGAEPWLCYWMCNAAHSPYGDITSSPSGCGVPDVAGLPVSVTKYLYTASYKTTHPLWSVWSAVENVAYELEILKDKIGQEVWDRTVVIVMGDNGSDHLIVNDYLNGYDYGGGITDVAHPGKFGTGYEALINDTTDPRFKGSAFSPGTRVPLIIRGPDEIVRNKGRASFALVDAVDVHATIRRITQSTYDDAVFDSRTIDGVDLCDILAAPDTATANEADRNHRSFSYSEEFEPNGSALSTVTDHRDRVYRKWRADGIWHLIKRKSKSDRLHRVMKNAPTPTDPPVTDDIHEQSNLVGSDPDVYQEMLLDNQALNASMTADQWPTE